MFFQPIHGYWALKTKCCISSGVRACEKYTIVSDASRLDQVVIAIRLWVNSVPRLPMRFPLSTILWLRKPTRGIATSSIRRDEDVATPEQRPRWQGAPARMYAPVRIPHSRSGTFDEFPVNTSPRVLDEVYIDVLGHGGHEVLTEEVKWLAVTHKSFDHGRRGYNDRLALLGADLYTPFSEHD